MSIASRIKIRERYLQGWNQMDASLLLASTADAFIFEDPAEPGPVSRDMLPDYMRRWDARASTASGNNEWRLTLETRTDSNGILTDWEWWEVIGTDLQGAAVVLTSDEGVLLERITYFDRNMRNPAAGD